jgi:uncharacterized protein YqeY
MQNVPILDQLKNDWLTARKAQDRVKTDALQSVLARISNAEAVPLDPRHKASDLHMGVGSTEAARRALSEQDVRQVIQDERDELHDAVAEMGGHADHPYAAELKQKAGLLSAYL